MEAEDEERGQEWWRRPRMRRRSWLGKRLGRTKSGQRSVSNKFRVSLMLELKNEEVQREILPVGGGEPGIEELADAGC